MKSRGIEDLYPQPPGVSLTGTTVSRLTSISDQVRHLASTTPQAIALLDVDGRSITYRELHARILQVSRHLRKQGIEKEDRIAIVLPSGADWVVAFLAVCSICAGVPMNPSSTSDETEKLLKQFRVTALLCSNVWEAPALPAAHNGIRIIQMSEIEPDRSSDPVATSSPQLTDLALLLATSGTTSRPKAVPLTHENVSISAHHLRDVLQLTATDRCLNLMPLFHRSGINAVLCSLFAGGSVVLVRRFSAIDFFDWMQRFSPTWYAGVPAMHRSILARSAANRSIIERHPLRFMRSSSSFIPESVADELQNTFQAPFIQTYNTTETALISATSFLSSLNKKGSVGRPASGEVAILDEAGGRVGPMTIGRIAVRGPNVMHRYEDDETANRAAFVNGWFQTGDRGYLDEDNYLFLKGRATAIINRGGQKISPEEIESVLLLHPAVEQAAVFAVPDSEFEEIPACAIVLRQNCSTSPLEIQEFLAKKLSAHKIPASVAFVEELPVTDTGKIDRLALARICTQEVQSAPMEEIQEMIGALWKSVLQIENVGLDDRFFQLGGDSLLATQLVNRLQETFHLDLPIATVFETSTIRLQSQYIAELQNTKSAKRKGIPRVPSAPHYPVSFPQQRMWFLYKLAPDSPVYNIAKQLTIRGPLNASALEKALQAIVERHESLRTNFISIDGVPQQVIKETEAMPVRIVDLSKMEQGEQEIEIERLRTQEARLPFNLEEDVLIRATLLKRNNNEHVLLLINHHIISDRWSANLFLEEFQQFYSFFNQGNAVLPQNIPIQYRDFASFQRRLMEDSDLENQLLYWKQQLSNAPLLNLPVNWAGRDAADFEGAKESLKLEGSLIEKIHEFCRQYEVTPFLFHLTLLQVILHRYSGQHDVLVGSPISGRFRLETEQLLGFFANTLVLRGDLSGEPAFVELLLRTRRVVFDAFANQEVPFEKVVEELNPSRSGGHSPLFDVVLTQVGTTRSMAFEGLDIAITEIYTGTAKFPLTLYVEETSNNLLISFQYSTALFSRDSIARMLLHFGNLIESALNNPDQSISQLQMLTLVERDRLLTKWSRNADACDTDDCIQKVFERVAESLPEAIAVREGPYSLTYRELNDRANSLAHYLRAMGTTTETAVGIALDRGLARIVAMLAILKAGGAYVPLDPEYPDERIRVMIDHAKVEFLITNELTRFANYKLRIICPDRDRSEIERQQRDNLRSEAGPDSVCYILYTSGSTGKPKGVCASHRGVVRIAHGLKFLQISAEDRFLQHSTISFDASTFEIWGALLNGACLVIPPAADHLSLQEMGKEIVENRITILWLTSALFSQMVEHASDSLSGLRYLLAGGDVLSVPHVKQALEKLPQVKLVNGYGPTETTTFACCHVVSECSGNSIPIGRPIANTTVYILDPYLEPVPAGVHGQLYIGGDGLARGYVNDLRLTKEKFIANPFEPGSRLYATGDVARWLPDSTIEFAGRLDHQLKIRGFRVEPTEIEAAIRDHPSVRDCAVVAKPDSASDQCLVAYVVMDPSPETSLKLFLGTKLPQYMIPSRIMIVDTLPLNASGKVDRLTLSAHSETGNPLNKARIAPRDALEFQLLDLWQKILKVQSIGITEDFFHLGGHSLLAAQLFARIYKLTGKDLPLSILFETPTVKGIAQILRNSGWSPSWNNLVAIQPAGWKPPFFCVHSLGGNVLLYKQLATHLGDDQPFFALQSSGLDGKTPPLRTIEEMATMYIEEIKKVQPEGPYYLGGDSLGGVIAFEIAQQLRAIGQEIRLLVAFDSSVARWTILKRKPPKPLLSIRRFAVSVRNFLRGGKSRILAVKKWKKWKMRTSHKLYRSLLRLHKRAGIPLPKSVDTVPQANFYAYSKYVPRFYPGKLTLFRAADNREKNPGNGWEYLCDEVEIIAVEGKHSTLMHEPYVRTLAHVLTACIEKARL